MRSCCASRREPSPAALHRMTRARRARRCGVVAARAHVVRRRCWAAVRTISAVGRTMRNLRQPALLPGWGGEPEAPETQRLRHRSAIGTLPDVPPSHRRQDVSWLPTVVPDLQLLLDIGHATRGMSVIVRGGHLVVDRTDDHGADPRFRLTPLGDGVYGLSLYRRKRWEPLPYEGTLQELAVTMNNDLGAWADDWS